MQRKFSKIYWLLLTTFGGCSYCENFLEVELGPPIQQQEEYYNLEAIDLGAIKADGELVFIFNNQQLTKEGSIYLSQDLLVYQTQDKKWRATVIGKGGISSYLKVNIGQQLLLEVAISTTSEVFNYQEALCKEWPGIYNIGNTCFANATYKLIARCSGFEQVLSKDIEGGINTALRNIVNGIRLGHRSALKEEVVNKKISALFLDVLYKADPSWKFNDRTQHDPQEFFLSIVNLLYPSPGGDTDEELQALLELPQLDNPFLHIYKGTKAGFESAIFPFTSNRFFPVKLPLFDIESSFILGRQLTEIGIAHEVIKPYYDAKTKNKIGEKKYKLIAVMHHIGSSMSSGHYVAYTNHGTQGWYLHNDNQVATASPPTKLRTFKWVGLYEVD